MASEGTTTSNAGITLDLYVEDVSLPLGLLDGIRRTPWKILSESKDGVEHIYICVDMFSTEDAL